MPKFIAENTGPMASTFSFSAVDMTTLGATEYTLVGLAVDCSGSVLSFAREEEKAIKAIVEACRRSPRADNLMLRYTRFDHHLTEVHGFKLLQDCNPTDYDNTIVSGGSTALYDAATDAADAVARYGRELQDNDFAANGIVFIITDGCDNASRMTPTAVRKSFERVVTAEALESLVTILIGVNVTDPSVADTLSRFATAAGFTQFVNIGEADEKKLAKLAAFVSKSISSQSQSLGSGSASVTLTF